MNAYLELGLEISAIVLFVIGLGFVVNVYAEIDYKSLLQLEKDVEETRAKLKSVNQNIVESKILLRELKPNLAEKLKEMSVLEPKKETDWNAASRILIVEKDVENLQGLIDSENQKLAQLETVRDTLKRSLEIQEEKLENDWRQFKIENTFDPSNYTKHIGIVLSEGCIELIKNNFNHTCPTYEDLYQLDTSNQGYSGKFINENGFFHRTDSLYDEGWGAYRHDPTLRIFVDPDYDHRNRMKMITLENNFDVYFVPEIDNKLHNNTRTYHELRYVDGCHQAQLSVMNWTKTLPDTIHYMRTGCGVTGIDEMVLDVRNSTEWNPLDSPGYHYRLWVENMLELCKGKC